MRFNVTTKLGLLREITLQSFSRWSLQRGTLDWTNTLKTGGFRG
jgi:hypothetical protein